MRVKHGIYRLEGKSNGHNVRLKKGDQNFSKFFGDKSSGGKTKSLEDALIWRDDILNRRPFTAEDREKILASDKKKALPQSGVPGIVWTRQGNGGWQVWYKTPSGKRSCLFSIGKKHADAETALKAAKSFRNTLDENQLLEARGVAGGRPRKETAAKPSSGGKTAASKPKAKTASKPKAKTASKPKARVVKAKAASKPKTKTASKPKAAKTKPEPKLKAKIAGLRSPVVTTPQA